ncbi:MAG: hypothetical protein WCR69_08245 [Sulfuricurvum sp.]
MRKIVLVDRGLELLDSIYKTDGIEISLLIVETRRQKENILASYPRVKNVYMLREIQFDNIYNLSYSEIETFKATQLKVMTSLLRTSTDLTQINEIYLNSLGFWLNIFSTTNIDALVLSEIELGNHFTSLPLDVAKFFSIKAFTFEPTLANPQYVVFSVKLYNSNEYISFEPIREYFSTVDIRGFLFNSAVVVEKKEKPDLKTRLMQFYFTPIGLFVQSVRSTLFRKYTKLMFYNMEVKWLSLFKGWIYIKKLKRFYDSVSSSPSLEQKFIFYAVHFEPEAAILARTTLNNQLYIIKKLHDALPDGYKLFLKEHPHQFDLANINVYYMLNNIDLFKTRHFYKQLSLLENVEILKFDTPSREIIKKAEAISTISGTASMEAIVHKKPVLLFGHRVTPWGACRDIFKIESSGEIDLAMRQIKDGFVPNYDDFDTIVDRYPIDRKEVLEGTKSAIFWNYLFDIDLDKSQGR